MPETTEIKRYDVAVIGGGPAGLAAATAAAREGASVLLIEREARLGGILKQCIHDGFGLVRFGEKLSGPEYAQRFIDDLNSPEVARQVTVRTLTFVTRAWRVDIDFALTLVSREGVETVHAGALVLATGCRERTAKQVGIHGTRPAGVYTAGAAQHYTNLLGQMPGRRCVVLGSGDIGLIMARRLTLEGAEVLGVYEAKPTPGGLSRNIAQCLHDFDIPLHTSHTVTRLFGHERLEAVEVAQVDEAMRPIPGTEEHIECDTLVLSVGLIPENELAESLSVPLDAATKGPVCDQNGMTMKVGIFTCGNAAHVNDLVDYVSESGEAAGRAAAHYEIEDRPYADVEAGPGFLYACPQRLEVYPSSLKNGAVVYFRVAEPQDNAKVQVVVGEREVLCKTYRHLRPPEMERIVLDFGGTPPKRGDVVCLRLIVEGGA